MAETDVARLDRFSSEFLEPLLWGGRAVVGPPLSPASLDTFATTRPPDLEVDRRVYEGLFLEASALAAITTLPHPDRGALALAMAGYDLLGLTDPKLDRVFARNARPTIFGFAAELLDAAGAPTTRGEVLCRHVVVSRLAALEREDSVVNNWAYTYRFHGRPIPANVVAMPKLRRVRVAHARKSALALWQELERATDLPVGTAVRTMLERSPLTILLAPSRLPAFRFSVSTASVLGDPALRRAVVRKLRASFEVADLVAYGQAVEALERSDPPNGVVTVVAQLFAELGVEEAIDRPPAMLVDRLCRGDSGMRLSAALFVLGARDHALSSGLAPADLAKVVEAVSRAEATLGERVLARASHLAFGGAAGRAPFISEDAT